VSWPSALAIYALVWAISAFVVMPFGMTADEAGIEKVPGQADSAPASFDFGKMALRTTIVAAVVFALFYANYVNGWVTTRAFSVGMEWGTNLGLR
jgi:predicted secreted protein